MDKNKDKIWTVVISGRWEYSRTVIFQIPLKRVKMNERVIKSNLIKIKKIITMKVEDGHQDTG